MNLFEVPDDVSMVRWKSKDSRPYHYHFATRVQAGVGTYWHSTLGTLHNGYPENTAAMSAYISNSSPDGSDEVEPVGILLERPSGCCGACPRILNGGYDCTCEHNPRCPNYTAPPLGKRIARALDRWLRIEERDDA